MVDLDDVCTVIISISRIFVFEVFNLNRLKMKKIVDWVWDVDQEIIIETLYFLNIN